MSPLFPQGARAREKLWASWYFTVNHWQYVHERVFAYALLCAFFSSRKQRNETIKYSANEPGTVSKAHACLECNTVGHRDRHTNRSLWRKIWARSSVKRQIQTLAFNYETSWQAVVVLLRKKRNQRVLMCVKHVGWLPIASHKLFKDFKVSASSQSLRNLFYSQPCAILAFISNVSLSPSHFRMAEILLLTSDTGCFIKDAHLTPPDLMCFTRFRRERERERLG